ncbi:globin domain-containing protein [Antrihabitans cavernicola]|uniref:nitric oxide dioxygenase n=1 Tax=Antrihabitans cavernicola TaxID=2495913 RepID=A0A5A7S712_9NOCA|nr:globin domain-containing protein [Spelaeibacter cavernicola]KAA0019464.1 oxidoreductase [Spelaeibacter cavernicola]
MDIAALQASWRDVEKVGDDATLYFYSHLFLMHPEVRDMFPVSMSAQRDRFFGALGRIVANVHELDRHLGYIEQLGRDHRRFDVVAAHYPAAGASLLATLQNFLGAAWTDSLAADWTAAFQLVADTMIGAATESEQADTPATWTAEIAVVERRSLDIAVLELAPTEDYPFLPGQSMAIELPSRPKLWRYFSPANAPRPDGTLEIHVQIVAGGHVSTALARSTRAGDTLTLGSPIGTDLTPPPPGHRGPVLMVAGSTGLAPMRSILDHIDQQWQTTGDAPPVQLFHGARIEPNLYDHHYLTNLADQRPWFDYTAVVSDDPHYRGQQGLVGDEASNFLSARGTADVTALVCGSPAMVDHAAGALTAAGLPARAILHEKFASEAPTETIAEEVTSWA